MLEYCESHIEMVKNIAEIKTKLEQIDQKIASAIEPMNNHVRQGEQWRIAILGIIIAGIIQVITFAYFWGSLNTTVIRNTGILENLVKLHTTGVTK